LRRIQLTKIAGESRHLTARLCHFYLGSNVRKRRPIARHEQQVSTVRSELAGAQPTEAAARSRDDRQHQ
jgi:hypothetical protein